MSKQCTVHGRLVDKVHGLSCQIIHAVSILFFLFEDYLCGALIDINDGLHQYAGSVLDELSHGVKVCGKVHGCGEDASPVLALGLSVKLLPPLAYIMEGRLVVRKYLHHLSLSVEHIAECGIKHGIIFMIRLLKAGLSHLCRSLHEHIYVAACNCYGQKSYCGKN